MFRLVAAVLAALLVSAPGAARWLVSESKHFRVFSDGTEESLREKTQTLEDYHGLLEQLTGRRFAENAPRLDLYMVGSHEQLAIVRPKLSVGVAGFYSPSSGGVLAMMRRSAGESRWLTADEILLHEYAHHFMFQTGAAALPAWYVEGFAEYLSTAKFTPTAIEFGAPSAARAAALAYLPWLPFDRLVASTCADLPRLSCDAFYAQSWLLAHYMFRAPGMAPKLTDYLARVGRGEPSAAAFRAAIGEDMTAFTTKLRAYSRGRNATFSRLPRSRTLAEDVPVTALPAGADRLLLPLLSMTLPQEEATDAANLKLVRAGAAAMPGDPFARRALAIAEAIAGDRAAGAAQLDALLAAAPNDTELLRWRARVYLDGTPTAENRTAARRLLARAFRAAPNDWRVLYAYAGTFGSGELPANVVDVWALTASLAPQVEQVRVAAGLALARAGRFEAAYAAVAPTVFNPHNTELPPEWRTLATALRDRNAAGVTSALAALAALDASARPPSAAGS